MPLSADPVSDDDYRRLLEFRTSLRRFLRWSEERAHAAGLTPAQHQLLLAIRGSEDPIGPTIGNVANSLLLRHHSVVELADRAAESGLVRRRADPSDHRAVRLTLTGKGRRKLASLSQAHLEELERLSSGLRPILSRGRSLGEVPGVQRVP